MTQHPIERSIALLRTLVAEDPDLEAELEASRARFFATPPSGDEESPERVLAERRHFEWFLFEHHGGEEDEPAARRLFDAWMARADVDLQVTGNALLHSHTGVFEIGDVEPGTGLWLHDLLGHGAYPVAETEASLQLRTGDVLAGRIFPVGDAQFRLSPAIACFRNERLLEALRHDLDELRAGRRGTLRLAQAEIERMFFGARSAAVGPALDPGAEAPETRADAAARLAAEVLALLTAGGVEAERAAAWIESLRATAQVAPLEARTTLGAELLDRLAFDTAVDLDAARRLIGEAWAVFADEPAARGETGPAAASGADGGAAPAGPVPEVREPGAREPEGPATSRPVGDGREAVEQALANYDRGRDAGRDLQELFDALETELGLDGDEVTADEPAPDFPGVVGAVVDEYLWEVGREREVGSAERATLAALGRYSRALGVFEDLGPEHLTAFATRWAVDRGLVADADAATALLTTLERFARWVEDEQQTLLWTSFARRAADLAASLPRTAAANAALGSATADVGDPDRHAVQEDLATERLGIEVPGGWRPLEAPAPALDHVRAGDQVAADLTGTVALVLRVYAPEAIDVDPGELPAPRRSDDGDDGYDD